MLIAKNIRKSYDKLQVLQGIDLSIAAGEVVALMGASGAGKSTLLRILATLDQPDAGAISLNGQDLLQLKGQALANFRNRQLGVVFQFHHLLPEFTALENVCMPGYISGDSKEKVTARGKELLSLMHLAHRLEHPPATLSGGEQQRVAIARALFHQPKIIFADEPSGNLDAENAATLHTLFLTLRDTLQQTFVLATHNPELAAMADRTIVLQAGKISRALCKTPLSSHI